MTDTTTTTPVQVGRRQATTLKRSYDRKVSPVVRRQTHNDRPALGNSFGLPAGHSCPGMTPFCGSCYAASLENAYPGITNLLAHNLDALKGKGRWEMIVMLDQMIEEFKVEHGKLVAKGRADAKDLIFRIHWDGDFFNAAYADAWAFVIERHDDVQFWAYTRTFDVVHLFDGLPNLALYLSIDQWNIDRARPLLAQYPWLKAAYCADTQHEAKQLASSLDRKMVPCPENVQRLPLVVGVVDVGDDGQGACRACGLCVYARKDVGFATKKV